MARAAIPTIAIEVNTVFRDLDPLAYGDWVEWHDRALWGDLKEQIPELTLSTITDTSKTLTAIIKSEDWLRLIRPEVTDFVNAHVGLFRSIREDYYVGQSQMDYEFGESKEYVTSIKPDTQSEKAFTSQLRTALREYWKTIPLKLSKSVISGIRNSIIRAGKVQLLDNTENIDDNIYIVPSIRRELQRLSIRLSSEFDEVLINTINRILEE